jgi:hypothetical protein
MKGRIIIMLETILIDKNTKYKNPSDSKLIIQSTNGEISLEISSIKDLDKLMIELQRIREQKVEKTKYEVKM